MVTDCTFVFIFCLNFIVLLLPFPFPQFVLFALNYHLSVYVSVLSVSFPHLYSMSLYIVHILISTFLYLPFIFSYTLSPNQFIFLPYLKKCHISNYYQGNYPCWAYQIFNQGHNIQLMWHSYLANVGHEDIIIIWAMLYKQAS